MPEVPTLTELNRRANLVLRCAWLRATARDLYTVDPGGQLSAQLADFADLLELVEERGWAA